MNRTYKGAARLLVATVFAGAALTGCKEPEAERAPPDPLAPTEESLAHLNLMSSPETLEEYAGKCDREIGVTVPDFNCDDGTLVPTTNYNGDTCDRPNRLNRECDPGSRFQVLARSDSVYVVAHCRKKRDVEGKYGDIAVIQHNSQNGATCFYQALRPGLDGHVKAPSKGTSAYDWLPPSTTAGIGCAGCHDNGPLIRSPYLTQLTGPNALPGAGDVTWNRDQPYRFVGDTFASWRVYKVEVAGNRCNDCHRLAVNNVNSGRGTARVFGLRATAPSEDHKNPHSPSSPIWMMPGTIYYDPDNEHAAQEIAACGAAFTSGATLPAGCRVTDYTGGAPKISFAFPSSGPPSGGTSVRIDGTDFDTAGNTKITFGGEPALSVDCPSSTQCFATTPPGNGVVDVVVTRSRSSAPIPSAVKFSYVPSVTGVEPATASPGDVVTIHGIGFRSSPGATQINFGTAPATSFSCFPGPDCTAIVPPGAGTVDVRVTVDGTTSTAWQGDRFTYPSSDITRIDTTSGSIGGGTDVNIFGHGFDPDTGHTNQMRVLFGGVPSDYVVCMSSTWCAVKSPAAASYGPVHITFTSFGATSTPTSADVFTYTPAALTSISRELISPTGWVFLNGYAPAAGVTVYLTSSDPAAVSLPASLSIPPGSSSASFGLGFGPIDHAETVTLTATTGGSTVSTTIAVSAWPALSLRLGADVLGANRSTTATISLATAAPAGGASVALTSSDPASIPLPASVTVPAGAQQAMVTITNYYGGAPKTVKLAASYAGASSNAVLTVPSAIECKPRQCSKGWWWNQDDCRCERGLPQ